MDIYVWEFKTVERCKKTVIDKILKGILLVFNNRYNKID